MLFELFIVGSFWFWALIVCEVVWLFTAVRYEKAANAWGAVVIFSVAMWLFGNFNVFSYAFYNPVFVMSCFAGYLVAGVLWSFAKWMFFNRAIKETYERMKETFLDNAGESGTKIPDSLKEDWVVYLTTKDHWNQHNDDWTFYSPKSYNIKRMQDVIPAAKDHKSDIMFWISFWPVSVLWSLLHDFIERIIHEIYNYFKSVYDGITRKMFAGIKDDFGKKP